MNPTFGALETALKWAADAGEAFDVVHFNGHGIWNRELGLGALCFEDPRDTDRLTERRDDKRSVAVNKGQLGTVRMLRERYDEALAIYAEARDIFERLGEPRMVATAWHQMGIVHRQAGQYDEAERTYRRSLAISVRERGRAGEASSLIELGNLYNAMGRLGEAATFYRQAADVYVMLQDQVNEGRARNSTSRYSRSTGALRRGAARAGARHRVPGALRPRRSAVDGVGHPA